MPPGQIRSPIVDEKNNKIGKIPNNLFLTPLNVTDTSTQWEELFNRGEAGIDTVWVTVPLDIGTVEPECSLWIENRTAYNQDGFPRKLEGILRKDYANILVKAYPERGFAKLEFNAARLVSEKSPLLLPPQALPKLVSSILDELRPAFSPSFDFIDSRTGELRRDKNWKSHTAFTRLDLARNLVIDDPLAMRQALSVSKPRYGKVLHTYWDFSGGWTIESKTRSAGSDRMYDKAAELEKSLTDEAIRAEEGLYRFEAQLKGDRLTRLGVKKLAHISNESVAWALERRWEQLNWAVTIAAPDSLERVLEPLSWNKHDEMMGFLRRSSSGDISVYSKDQLSRLRGKARELGLQPGLPIEAGGVPARRLDLLAGGFIDLQTPGDSPT